MRQPNIAAPGRLTSATAIRRNWRGEERRACGQVVVGPPAVTDVWQVAVRPIVHRRDQLCEFRPDFETFVNVTPFLLSVFFAYVNQTIDISDVFFSVPYQEFVKLAS
uniref:Uncharacterized protein n=1 Tax=Plectus sambesii TaxID=2011161 RepID=A0A914WNY1_9BILA